jgi:hypothetical protein
LSRKESRVRVARCTIALALFTLLMIPVTPGGPVLAQQQYPSPVIAGVSPSTIESGKTSDVTISGKYFLDGARVSITPSGGSSIGGVKWLSAETIVASVVVATNAVPGARDVTVTNPNQQSATASRSLTIVATSPSPTPSVPAPVVTGVSPKSLEVGQTAELAISGKSFDSAVRLTFTPASGISIDSLKVSSDIIRAIVSVEKNAPPGAIDVTVTNSDGQYHSAKAAITIRAGQTPKPSGSPIQPTSLTLTPVSAGLPLEQIIKANTLSRYDVTIESMSGNIVLQGEVDEAKQSLHFRVSGQQRRPPADFYMVDGQGYGRPGPSGAWLKTVVPALFPDYLSGMLMVLKGEISSVNEEGQTWKVEVAADSAVTLMKNYISEAYRQPSTGDSDAKMREVMRRISQAAGDPKIVVTLWLSRKDYRIQRARVQSSASQKSTELRYTFKSGRGSVRIPGEALKATGEPLSPGLLLLNLPSIQGWLESTHRLLAQQSIGLIERADVSEGRYTEIYNRGWGSTDPTASPPTPSNHPLIIGVHNEDNTGTRPSFYDTWLINAGSYFTNDYYRDYSHFGGLDLGLAYDVIFELRGCPNPPLDDRYYSARDWGYGGDRINRDLNGMTFTEAVKQYDRNTAAGRRNAYLMMGHVLHLFQDQANSDHARLVAHPGSSMTEGEALATFYILELWIAQAVLAAPADPISEGIAALVAYIGYLSWAEAGTNDVGYERLVGNRWNGEIETRIGAQIRSVVTRPDYDTYFRDVSELSIGAADRRGLSSPLGLGHIPAIWILGVYAPLIDPDIDITNEAETRPYLELTDEVAVPAITMGAGLLEHFYEIVNPPPIVSSVMVVEGGAEAPTLFDRGSDVYGEIRYHAHWIDRFPFFSRWFPSMKYVSSRSFRVEKDFPVRAGKQAYIFIELGPTISPDGGKVAEEIEVTAGGTTIPLGLRTTDAGRPYYLGTLPVLNCGETELRLPLEITARDRSAHLESRDQPGYELDANPATVVRTAVFSGGEPTEPLVNYEPGPDRHYQIRFAPAVWRVDVSPSNRDRLPVRIPASHTVTLTVESLLDTTAAPTSPPIEMWLPGTACPVRWELDTKVTRMTGGPPEEGTASGYNFSKLLLTIPGEAVCQLAIQPGPDTPPGSYTVIVRYYIGSRVGSTPVIFEFVR